MKWVDYHEWADLYPNHIILKQEWHTNRVLMAHKGFIVLKPIFSLYDRFVVMYYNTLRLAIRYGEKRGWLKCDPSHMICWASMKEWRKNAIMIQK